MSPVCSSGCLRCCASHERVGAARSLVSVSMDQTTRSDSAELNSATRPCVPFCMCSGTTQTCDSPFSPSPVTVRDIALRPSPVRAAVCRRGFTPAFRLFSAPPRAHTRAVTNGSPRGDTSRRQWPSVLQPRRIASESPRAWSLNDQVHRPRATAVKKTAQAGCARSGATASWAPLLPTLAVADPNTAQRPLPFARSRNADRKRI